MLPLYTWVEIATWALFLVVWATASFGVKRDTKPRAWGKGFLARVLVFIVIVFFGSRFPALRAVGAQRLFVLTPALGWGAALLSVLGVAVAIWARACLGRNWSSHPDIKIGHELVTGGPYAYVRHPIYTGVILMLIASALTATVFWLFVCVAVAALFLWRIPTEEQYMQELFPNEYPAYRARTKRLVPFVW